MKEKVDLTPDLRIFSVTGFALQAGGPNRVLKPRENPARLVNDVVFHAAKFLCLQGLQKRMRERFREALKVR